jgi:hypothetical protein
MLVVMQLHETLTTPSEEAGDLIVVGAGSAGLGAALAAARLGLRVTLLDPANHVGGTLVSGVPILGYHDGERQIVGGIASELAAAMHRERAAVGDPARRTEVEVDHERLKLVLWELLEAAGVQVRLHTLCVGVDADAGRIRHVIVEGKGGRRALACRLVIDASGDADVAVAAGVPTVVGRGGDGRTQPMTLMFGVGGIDQSAFIVWGGGEDRWVAYQKMEALWRETVARGGFRNPRTNDFSCFWGVPCRVGEWAFNATRILDADGTDSVSLTRAEGEGRRQVFELVDRFLRPSVPGFSQAYVAWTAAKIGVRESRRIVGAYTLTRQDIWDFATFPDTICHGSYPIDIHSPTGATTDFRANVGHFYGGRHWSVPFRCLVPNGVANLLVAGRCLSAEHEALAAVRVNANTIAMGEAAGVAAALAHRGHTDPGAVDPARLRRQLVSQGAWLPDA